MGDNMKPVSILVVVFALSFSLNLVEGNPATGTKMYLVKLEDKGDNNPMTREELIKPDDDFVPHRQDYVFGAIGRGLGKALKWVGKKIGRKGAKKIAKKIGKKGGKKAVKKLLRKKAEAGRQAKKKEIDDDYMFVTTGMETLP